MLEMGVAGRPHGIKGELSINWFGKNQPVLFNRIFIKEKDSFNPYHILSSRLHKGRLLVILENINNRTLASELTGKTIYIEKQDLPPLEDGEFYVEDLQNAEIYLKDNTYAGVFDHLELPAGQEIWVIKTKEGKEILFPARQEFIMEIDPARKRVIIDPPSGLLDIYNA